MDDIKEVAFAACSAFIVIEIIYFLAPKELTMKWICGLVYTLVIITGIMGVIHLDLEELDISNQGESNYNASSLYVSETQNNLNLRIKEAMSAAGVTCTDVTSLLNINDSMEISVDKIQVGIWYQSDRERATVILNNLFGDLPGVEVYVDGQ